MKKNILAGLALAALALTSASTSVVADSGMVRIDWAAGECNFLDQYGNVVYDSEVGFEQTNKAGNGVYKCYATGVANDTGKAIRFSGLPGCYVNDVPTTRMWEVIDTEGNMTLTCQVK